VDDHPVSNITTTILSSRQRQIANKREERERCFHDSRWLDPFRLQQDLALHGEAVNTFLEEAKRCRA
jgi:hypothetical protein